MADPILKPTIIQPSTAAPEGSSPEVSPSASPAGQPASEGTKGPAVDSSAEAKSAEPPKPEAKAARLLLKEQEARRKLEAERAALKAEKDAIAAEKVRVATLEASLQAEFKKNPMAFAKKYGVSYEDITKAAIAEASASTPQAQIEELRQQIAAEKAAKEKAEQEAKDRQAQAETQARIATYINGIHEHATKAPDEYALIGALEKDYARQLIYDVADTMAAKAGKVPTAKEVCDQIEGYLENEAAKQWEALQKKQKKPGQAAAPAPEPGDNPDVARMVEQFNSRAKAPPRNLTNRATAAPVKEQPKNGKMSRDEAIKAAIAAGIAAAGKQ